MPRLCVALLWVAVAACGSGSGSRAPTEGTGDAIDGGPQDDAVDLATPLGTCGNLVCEFTLGETCKTCSEDCGICQCQFACATPSDCAFDQGAFSADNYVCLEGTCRYVGCHDDAECAVSNPAAGRCPAGQGQRLCTPRCNTPADCTLDTGAFSGDNYACTDHACVYQGCLTSAECIASLGAGSGCFDDAGFKYCQRTCTTPADCALDDGASSADNYECTNGFCKSLGCTTSAECNQSSVQLVCPGDCVPDCTGRACGSDPVCGLSCGSCVTGTCSATGTCDGCEPQCTGRECGADPQCGVSCGACTFGEACDGNGHCQAVCPAPPYATSAGEVAVREPGASTANVWWLWSGDENVLASPVTYGTEPEPGCGYEVCRTLGAPYCSGMTAPATLPAGTTLALTISRDIGTTTRQWIIVEFRDGAIQHVVVSAAGTSHVWTGPDSVLTSVSITGGGATPTFSWEWAP